MVEASRDKFIDRRTLDETKSGLATQILFWYDKDNKNRSAKKQRRRTNGLAISMEGDLVVARATCSRKDQFVRADGRLKVLSRILGRAKKHCWIVTVPGNKPEDFATAYLSMFPEDEMGSKRAFNAGKIFARYTEEIQRRASGILDA